MVLIKHVKHVTHLIRHATRKLHEATKRSPHWAKVEKQHLSVQPTCAACGSSIRLNVHHIRPFHLHPELELDPNNLITLCMEIDRHCHILIGHGDDFKAYNPQVVEDSEIVKEDLSKHDEVAAKAKQQRLYE